MALIECKVCGKQVSDKAKTCPSCGAVLLEEEKAAPKTCQECGLELPDGVTVCPNCGCPIADPIIPPEPPKVEVTKVSMPIDNSSLKKVVTIALSVVVLIALVLAGVSISKKNATKKEAEEYAQNLTLCSELMYSGAADAESAATLIHDVWNNCIVEKKDSTTDPYTRTKNGSGWFYDDFNDALSNLFNDHIFQQQIGWIKDNQTSVAKYMKNLKNPPDEYKEAFDALKDLYEVYCTITDCAVNPTGSLNSFTSTFNTADSDFIKYYKAFSVYK